MGVFRDKLVAYIQRHPGLSDRQLADALEGRNAPQQHVNAEARRLAAAGRIARRKRADGILGNYVGRDSSSALHTGHEKKRSARETPDGLSEDEVKQHLKSWLKAQGWKCRVAWGHARGVDIEAKKGAKRWLIEVKGIGSRPEMRVNYFIGILGETLQRMEDPDAVYSIALPDVRQFRGLWERLPELAKRRTKIAVLFVDREGNVEK